MRFEMASRSSLQTGLRVQMLLQAVSFYPLFLVSGSDSAQRPWNGTRNRFHVPQACWRTHIRTGGGGGGGGCCSVRRCVWHADDAGSAPQCGVGFFSPGQPSVYSYRDRTTLSVLLQGSYNPQCTLTGIVQPSVYSYRDRTTLSALLQGSYNPQCTLTGIVQPSVYSYRDRTTLSVLLQGSYNPQCTLTGIVQPSVHSYRDRTTLSVLLQGSYNPHVKLHASVSVLLKFPQHWQPHPCLDTKSQHAVSQPSKMNCSCWSGWQLKMVVFNTYPENGCYYFPKKKRRKTKSSRQKSWHKSTIRNQFQLHGAAMSGMTFSRKSIHEAAQGTKSWMKKMSKTKWWVTLHFNVWQCAQLGEPVGFSWRTACTGARKQMGEPVGFSWRTACTGARKQMGEPVGFSWGTVCTGVGKQMGKPVGFSWGTACTGAGKQLGEPEGFSWGMLASKFKIVTWDKCKVRSGRTMRESELVSMNITHLNTSSICWFDLKLNHHFLCWKTSHKTKCTSFSNSLAVNHLLSNINEDLLRVLFPEREGSKHFTTTTRLKTNYR